MLSAVEKTKEGKGSGGPGKRQPLTQGTRRGVSEKVTWEPSLREERPRPLKIHRKSNCVRRTGQRWLQSAMTQLRQGARARGEECFPSRGPCSEPLALFWLKKSSSAADARGLLPSTRRSPQPHLTLDEHASMKTGQEEEQKRSVLRLGC